MDNHGLSSLWYLRLTLHNPLGVKYLNFVYFDGPIANLPASRSPVIRTLVFVFRLSLWIWLQMWEIFRELCLFKWKSVTHEHFRIYYIWCGFGNFLDCTCLDFDHSVVIPTRLILVSSQPTEPLQWLTYWVKLSNSDAGKLEMLCQDFGKDSLC